MLRTKDYAKIVEARNKRIRSKAELRDCQHLQVSLYLSVAEYLRLKTRAEAASMSQAEFIRALACR